MESLIKQPHVILYCPYKSFDSLCRAMTCGTAENILYATSEKSRVYIRAENGKVLIVPKVKTEGTWQAVAERDFSVPKEVPSEYLESEEKLKDFLSSCFSIQFRSNCGQFTDGLPRKETIMEFVHRGVSFEDLKDQKICFVVDRQIEAGQEIGSLFIECEEATLHYRYYQRGKEYALEREPYKVKSMSLLTECGDRIFSFEQALARLPGRLLEFVRRIRPRDGKEIS